MTKTKLKKLSAMAVSVVMAASMVGVAKAAGTFHTATASALTAVTEDATIGIGVDNQATSVQISTTEPATLSLVNVAAGRYVVYLYVTETVGEDPYIISAQVDNGTAVDLVMDQNIYKMDTDYNLYYAYVGTVDVTAQSTSLTLSVRHRYTESVGEVTLTVDSYLAPFTLVDSQHLGGIAVNSTTPATLSLSNVTPGKYVLHTSIIEQKGENEIVLNAAVGGSSSELRYSASTGDYSTIIDVTSTSTVTLSSEGDNSYILDVRLVPYVVTSPDLSLTGVVIAEGSPAEIPLVDVSAADYIVTVDLGDVILEDDVTVTAMVNGGTAVTLERDNNYVSAYTGTVTVSAGTTTLTIKTSTAQSLIVTVSLTEILHQDPLPTGDVTLNLYEPVLYEYSVDTSGYYVISTKNIDVADAGVDIYLKNDPESFDSTEIHGNDFPTYLEEGKLYYYEATYTGIEILNPDPEGEIVEAPEHATFQFSVDKWANPNITLEDNYYVPVPSSEPIEDDKLTFDSSITAGEYTLSLFDIPMFVRLQGAEVYLHYGSGTPIALNEGNGYAANISISATDRTFYFTTDAQDPVTDIVTLGLIVTEAQPAEPTTLNLFTANTVTLNAGETKEYFVENLGAGVYTINLGELEGQSIVVTSGTSENPIISAGESTGTLTLVLSGEAATATVALMFENESATNAEFTVTIQPVNYSDFGEAENMTLRVNYAYSSYMQLEAGIYQVNLSNVAEGKNVRVFADGKEVYLNADNMGVFKVANSGYVNMAYIYFDAGAGLESPETTTVTSTVTTATGLQSLETEEDYNLQFTATNRVLNYTMELTTGTYSVSLTGISEHVQVMMLVDGEEVLAYGATEANFTIAANSTVVITFVYSGTEESASVGLFIE